MEMEEIDDTCTKQKPSGSLQPESHNVTEQDQQSKNPGEDSEDESNNRKDETLPMEKAELQEPKDENNEATNDGCECEGVISEEEKMIRLCNGNTNQNNNDENNIIPDKKSESIDVESSGTGGSHKCESDDQNPENSLEGTIIKKSESNICASANTELDTSDRKSEHMLDGNLSYSGCFTDATISNRNDMEDKVKLGGALIDDAQSKNMLQSNSNFNERISSDGGSVEIAEEAEEDCNAHDQTETHMRTPPVPDCSHDINNISDHSKEVQASSTSETEDTSPHPVNHSIPTSSMDNCHVAPLQRTEVPAQNSDSSFSEQETNSDKPIILGDPGHDSKIADNIEDDLLSELAAELDEVTPVKTITAAQRDLPSESNSSTMSGTEEGVDETDDIAKLRRLVDDWKRKYCHAEAELQSLQARAHAKASQQKDEDEQQAKIAAEVKKETDAVRKVHLLRIQELEKEVEQRKRENAAARERQISHDTAAKKAINQLQHEMVQRVDQVKRLYEESVKEKENMVIRYAKSEKENLDLKKAKEEIERKRKEVGQGLEVIGSHNKQLKAERTKLISELDAKDLEIARLQKEKEEMQDDVSSVGIKVKWAQNKLKTELESHKETKAKLSKTEQRLQEAKEETEQIRKNCQEMIRTYQESEEIRSNSLDIQLKEKEEELKLHFQEKEDHMELHNTRVKELTSLKKAHQDTLAELDSLKVKAKCLEDERLHTEGLLTQFKGLLNSQKEENRKLTRQMDELKTLKRQLDESKENVVVLEKRIASRKEDEKDLESELERSRGKESELLQFTEKMTAKNAALHSDNNILSAQVDKLTDQCRNLTSELQASKLEISQLTADLNQEKQYREREAALLSARLSEKTKALDQVKVQLDDAKDETKTLKRKNAANLKDLTRQLHLAKKKIESLESDGSAPVNHKDNFSSESRTSSTGSLDTLGNSALNGGTINMSSGSSGGSVGRQDDSPQAGQDHTVAIAGGNDFPGIDKGMLVDRIVKLQKQMQRKVEKIEFLQEHNGQLIEELQKKSKIIQQYIMREEAGALVPAVSDVNKQKLVRKTMAQMSKQSGIMASLYRSNSTPDPNMTLDLSLEINRKLQAVLEDTLLKNITLKENIDTLGQEIARLSEEARFTSTRRSKTSRKT